MILQEVEVTWPYQEDPARIQQLLGEGFSRKEAVRRDFDRRWKGRRRRFEAMASCVPAAVCALMGRPVTSGYWKIEVECCRPESWSAPFVDGGGVMRVPLEFDPAPLLLENDTRVVEASLHLVRSGVVLAERASGDDLSPVLAACDGAADDAGVVRWEWGRKKAPSGLVATVDVSFEVARTLIALRAVDPSGALVSEATVGLAPNAFDLRRRYLGSLRWESERLVVLSAASGFRLALEVPADRGGVVA